MCVFRRPNLSWKTGYSEEEVKQAAETGKLRIERQKVELGGFGEAEEEGGRV
jgi:hypothetical protein